MSFFYMLHVEGGGAPTVKHNSQESAKREAERLARTTGQRVHVLKSVASCLKSDVHWKFADPAEVPPGDDAPDSMPF